MELDARELKHKFQKEHKQEVEMESNDEVCKTEAGRLADWDKPNEIPSSDFWVATKDEVDGNSEWMASLLGNLPNKPEDSEGTPNVDPLVYQDTIFLVSNMVKEYSRLMWFNRPEITRLEAICLLQVLNDDLMVSRYGRHFDPRKSIHMKITDTLKYGFSVFSPDDIVECAKALLAKNEAWTREQALSIIHSVHLATNFNFPISKAFKLESVGDEQTED
jgi:hypothetical protein